MHTAHKDSALVVRTLTWQYKARNMPRKRLSAIADSSCEGESNQGLAGIDGVARSRNRGRI